MSKADQEQVRRRAVEGDLALVEKQRLQLELELQELRAKTQSVEDDSKQVAIVSGYRAYGAKRPCTIIVSVRHDRQHRSTPTQTVVLELRM